QKGGFSSAHPARFACANHTGGERYLEPAVATRMDAFLMIRHVRPPSSQTPRVPASCRAEASWQGYPQVAADERWPSKDGQLLDDVKTLGSVTSKPVTVPGHSRPGF
ncbi:hypothetical protein LEMLEM_LOCUS6660, partial [Lemmus lemmus]